MANQVSLPLVQTTDRNINQLQQNIKTVVNQLQQQINNLPANPTSGGVIVSGALTTSPTSISQGLGAVPTGWIITDIDAAATVYRTAWDSSSITLVASGNCNVSVLVF